MSNDFDFDALFEEAQEQTNLVLEEDFINESLIDEEIKDNPNIQPATILGAPKKAMSFNAPKLITNKPKPGKRFITRETVIDKFNTRRVRVELTPSVCDICAFDVVAKRFGNWHNVPELEKEKVTKALEEHKRVAHPLNQNFIIDEDELPKQWLGR